MLHNRRHEHTSILPLSDRTNGIGMENATASHLSARQIRIYIVLFFFLLALMFSNGMLWMHSTTIIGIREAKERSNFETPQTLPECLNAYQKIADIGCTFLPDAGMAEKQIPGSILKCQEVLLHRLHHCIKTSSTDRPSKSPCQRQMIERICSSDPLSPYTPRNLSSWIPTSFSSFWIPSNELECRRFMWKHYLQNNNRGQFQPSLLPWPTPVQFRVTEKDSSPAPDQELLFTRIPFIIYAFRRPSPENITVATHGGVSKLNRLLQLASLWNGHVSFAMYSVSPSEDLKELANFFSKHESELKLVDVHMLISKVRLKSTHGIVDAAKDGEYADAVAYPFNYMRNLAMDAAPSDYILGLDVDFFPNPAAELELSDLLINDHTRNQLRNERTVFVVPAFQRLFDNERSVDDIILPDTKDELRAEIAKKHGQMLKEFHLPEYHKGHGPTNYKLWYEASEPYPVEYKFGYEPYVVFFRPMIPHFWNAFRGFGW